MRKSTIESKKNGLSLIEVMVALAIFSASMAAASGVFVAIQDAWRRQKTTIELIQNGRWAMEFMTNEIRTASSEGHPGYQKLKDKSGGKQLIFANDANGDYSEDTQMEYLLNTTTHTIERRQRAVGPNGPWSAWVVLVNHVVTPAAGAANRIFDGDKDGYVVIKLTLRPDPDPASPEGFGNRNITFRTSVIARND